MSHWIALFLAVAGNVGANVAFKRFVTTTEFGRSWSSVVAALMQPSLWIGLSCGVAIIVLYLYAIRSIPISVAYTMATTVSISGVTLVGVLMYGEPFSLRMAAGIATVMLGVTLITA